MQEIDYINEKGVNPFIESGNNFTEELGKYMDPLYSQNTNAKEEKQMAYNATNAKEQPTLPQDTIFIGVILSIDDGTVSKFVKDTSKWQGDVNQEAIELQIEVVHNDIKYPMNQLFTYNEENGKTVFSQKSNLGKYKAKYSKLPEVGDQVKLMTNNEGFLKLKLE